MQVTKKDFLSYALIIGFALSIVIWALIDKKKLEKNHRLSTGRVKSYSSGGRGNGGGLDIDYVFRINNIEHNGSTAFLTSEISFSNAENLLGKSFPVVYYVNNPSNSIILIKQKDFERFGYTFPDSLKWVSKYFKE